MPMVLVVPQITHLFKQVLHGNGRFVMVVNVSPASEAFNETKRVLQVTRRLQQLCRTVQMTASVAASTVRSAWSLMVIPQIMSCSVAVSDVVASFLCLCRSMLPWPARSP